MPLLLLGTYSRGTYPAAQTSPSVLSSAPAAASTTTGPLQLAKDVPYARCVEALLLLSSCSEVRRSAGGRCYEEGGGDRRRRPADHPSALGGWLRSAPWKRVPSWRTPAPRFRGWTGALPSSPRRPTQRGACWRHEGLPKTALVPVLRLSTEPKAKRTESVLPWPWSMEALVGAIEQALHAPPGEDQAPS